MLSKISLMGAIIFVILLFWGGGQPGAVGLFEPPFDKIAHLTAFGVFGLLLWLGFQGRWPLLIIILAGCIGALDEWRQAFLPGRAVSVGDFAMDIIAVMVVVGIMSLREKFLRERRE